MNNFGYVRANDVADRTHQHDQHATRRRRDLRGDGFRRGHCENRRGRLQLQRSMITTRTGAAKGVAQLFAASASAYK